MKCIDELDVKGRPFWTPNTKMFWGQGDHNRRNLVIMVNTCGSVIPTAIEFSDLNEVEKECFSTLKDPNVA